MIDKTKATFREYDIIRYPLMSEKSTKVLETSNAYVFVVDITATKTEIKSAIEKIFGVKVVSVNTSINKGKNKVFRGKPGRRSDFKKAVVRVQAGDKIELGVGV